MTSETKTIELGRCHYQAQCRVKNCAAKATIVSRGPWKEQGNRDALEVLFEDGSDSPYAIHLVREQTDRLLPASEHGRSFTFAVWTRAGKQLELPGKYRVVAAIPCLDP